MPHLGAAMTVYFIFISAVLGLVMGSFLNCFACRYASGESVSKGRSHCASCSHILSAKDLIPIVSWVSLGGKCRYCAEKISAKYMLSEILCALIFVSIFLRYGLSFEALKLLIFACLLFAAAFTDIYCGEIPDRLWMIGAFSSFAYAAIFPDGTIFHSILVTLRSGLSVALPLLIFVLIFDKIMKKETMGGGDIKLIFFIGLFFDWKTNIFILILACIIGLILAFVQRPKAEQAAESGGGNEDDLPAGAFAFGPALAIAAWIALMFGEYAINWYMGLF